MSGGTSGALGVSAGASPGACRSGAEGAGCDFRAFSGIFRPDCADAGSSGVAPHAA